MKTKLNTRTIVTSLTAAAMTIGSTLITCTAIASETTDSYQTQRPVSQAIPEGLQTQQPRVEYIWPSVQPSLTMVQDTQEIHSDYYYQIVTGAQLSKGVKVYTTTDGALLRLAPKADYTSGVKMQSRPLDLEQLSLTGAHNKSLVLKQLASVEAMKLAGFDDGSVALRLPSHPENGPMVLKSRQVLADDAQYLLQVKEKGTPYSLTVKAANVLDKQDGKMALRMTMAGKTLQGANTEVQLLSPTGPAVPVVYHSGQVSLPDNMETVGAWQGLYELQLTTLVNFDGTWVKRSAKVPFAQHVNTAELGDVLTQQGNYLYLPVTVHEPGRYAVTATLQGKDKSGRVVNIQTADVAQYFNRTQDVRLPFKLDSLREFTGPFKLVNVQLKDQGRLMPLQQTASIEQAPDMM